MSSRSRTATGGRGRPLPHDANGIGAEAIVRLADGSFWIGEENGPSLAHFAADGRMIARHVPAGTDGELAGARYEVRGTLPAILARRAINRGIESLAVSPDERFLYFVMQNPLANPDVPAYRSTRNTRLYKLERSTMRVVGEYVYALDDPRSFRRDPSERQSDPRISEMMAIGPDRLVVLVAGGRTQIVVVRGTGIARTAP